MDAFDALDSLEPMTIRKQVDIEAPAERIWRYIGTQAGLSEWFMADVILETDEGGRYQEEGIMDADPYCLEGEVETYDPPLQLSVAVRQVPASDEENAVGIAWPAFTTFTITLRALVGTTVTTMAKMPYTRVTVEHSGFEQLPKAYRRTAFDNFDAGWANLMERLPELIPLSQA